jgi:hypothetical protein
MATRRRVELDAFLQMVTRIVRAAGRRVGDGDVDDLRVLLLIRQALDEATVEAVRGLREAGCTWEDIGQATGTTRQAALMRWGPKLNG